MGRLRRLCGGFSSFSYEPTIFDTFPCLCIWRRTAANVVAGLSIIITIFMLIVSGDKYGGDASNFIAKRYDAELETRDTEKVWHRGILIGGSVALIVHFLLFFAVTIVIFNSIFYSKIFFSKLLVISWVVWSVACLLLHGAALILLRFSENPASLALLKEDQHEKFVSWLPIIYGITSPIGPILHTAGLIVAQGRDDSKSLNPLDRTSDYTVMCTIIVFGIQLFLIASVLAFWLEIVFLEDESKELKSASATENGASSIRKAELETTLPHHQIQPSAPSKLDKEDETRVAPESLRRASSIQDTALFKAFKQKPKYIKAVPKEQARSSRSQTKTRLANTFHTANVFLGGPAPKLNGKRT